jgi:hypothetical protein
LIYEKEDIELHKIQISLLKEDLNKGVLRDAKTIIGLQWFMMTHPTFFSVK